MPPFLSSRLARAGPTEDRAAAAAPQTSPPLGKTPRIWGAALPALRPSACSPGTGPRTPEPRFLPTSTHSTSSSTNTHLRCMPPPARPRPRPPARPVPSRPSWAAGHMAGAVGRAERAGARRWWRRRRAGRPRTGADSAPAPPGRSGEPRVLGVAGDPGSATSGGHGMLSALSLSPGRWDDWGAWSCGEPVRPGGNLNTGVRRTEWGARGRSLTHSLYSSPIAWGRTPCVRI